MCRPAWLLGLTLLTAVGCQNYDRPRDLRGKPRPDDPRLTIEEQQARGRARYAIPEDHPEYGPRGYIDRPSPTGR